MERYRKPGLPKLLLFIWLASIGLSGCQSTGGTKLDKPKQATKEYVNCIASNVAKSKALASESHLIFDDVAAVDEGAVKCSEHALEVALELIDANYLSSNNHYNNVSKAKADLVPVIEERTKEFVLTALKGQKK